MLYIKILISLLMVAGFIFVMLKIESNKLNNRNIIEKILKGE